MIYKWQREIKVELSSLAVSQVNNSIVSSQERGTSIKQLVFQFVWKFLILWEKIFELTPTIWQLITLCSIVINRDSFQNRLNKMAANSFRVTHPNQNW